MQSYKVSPKENSPWTRVSGLSFSQAKAQGLKVLLNSSWLLLKTRSDGKTAKCVV